MGRCILLALCCALLGLHVAFGQGTRRLRYTFSLFPVYRDSSNYNSPKIYILSTTDKYQVTGVLNVPFKSLSYPFSVDPLGMSEISLPSSSVGRYTGASDTTITIEANADVVVYGYSQYSSYQDSFYVIPLKHTGTEYYISSYNHYTSDPGSYFALTSFFDDTNVTIYFSQQYSYSGDTYDRDNPLQLELNAFDNFLFEVSFDFTGTFINASKDLSVSCGHPYTRTVSGVDTLVEFPPPVESWGSYFLVTTFRLQASYTLRILPSQNNTLVTLRTIGLNDTREVTIQPGNFHEEKQLPSSLEVFSSAPVMLVQYMTTDNPSMTLVPPLDRTKRSPLFLNSLEGTYIDVTVWFSSLDNLNLRVDGLSVEWEEILTDESGWSVVQARLGPDNHILNHDDSTVKLAALAYYDGSSHPVMYFNHADNDVDNQAPFVYGCPEEPIMAEMPPNEKTVAVYWEPLEAADNSGLEVKTVSNHNPGDLFPLGSTTVTYSFKDVSGNNSTCQFEVFVADVSPPLVLYCPSNFELATCAEVAEISWEEPQVNDESGHVISNSSHNPGDKLSIGNTRISYIFSDSWGNEAVCDFVVTIDPKECQPPTVVGLIVAIAVFSLAIAGLVVTIVYMIVKTVKS
ncbi:Sushi, von Willebrand factor type A, EGF and pentraxin domain-containing protein 1 [Holothuria leucospilota]|uniref:Sushi, von Willebrand factor type A, EGF and pentraxin domain-containing protein 1 n=1 Tax=Holothuria leucospilota TaxID=206669 RepID=A0A9Q1BXB9_HOLLE|nr:Sushi, von Willebrand factor type A, EGF and pentraxin domain-containing protein 1 [Holothuria leucospilota]